MESSIVSAMLRGQRGWIRLGLKVGAEGNINMQIRPPPLDTQSRQVCGAELTAQCWGPSNQHLEK